MPRGTPAGSYETFDGGYAQVIRATDYPAPPSSRVRPPNAGRPAGPERPAGLEDPVGPADPASPTNADVFVYRDTGGPPDGQAAGSPVRDPAEHDAAYWYDLLAEDAAPRREETRGPFEPLVSSGAPAGPGAAPTATAQARTAQAGTAQAGTAQAGTAQAGTGPTSPDDTAQARARQLEQLRDLYLTAEAIGEQNVDKHFDQILARQRELISEYFRQSAAAGPGGPRPGGPQPGQSGPAVAGPRDGTAEGAGVAAEQPHTW